MKTFLIFRQKCLDTLCCAVPEDFAVPSFLTPHNWEFSGIVETGNLPDGFRFDWARSLSQLNGFYLYHSIP